MRVARVLSILTLSLAAGAVVPAAEPPAEPKALQATTAVQVSLDEADRLLGERKPQEALIAAERALAASGLDLAGQARAQTLRARSFEALERTEDALEAWRRADESWQRLDAVPERIEAICGQAVLVGRSDPAGVAPLVEKAASLALEETATFHC